MHGDIACAAYGAIAESKILLFSQLKFITSKSLAAMYGTDYCTVALYCGDD